MKLVKLKKLKNSKKENPERMARCTRCGSKVPSSTATNKPFFRSTPDLPQDEYWCACGGCD